ncbi:hypothetical protein [Streptococcus gallolyticus]|uniref:hypothetical protein n=1 Tax=Streptococcus gallolyticus TaxID=315405 RepID=UPI00228356D3|nr:hypothetical protein [Streptococcus gallolyticus]MCY7191591.1 hypothetical protein [Streptococcus gallolyticus subsp. gallolyticus]
MKVISDNILFRLEKFGGILINKSTFDRMELNEVEACFLYLTQNCGKECALKYFQEINYEEKINRVKELNIYVDVNRREKLQEIQLFFNEAREKINFLKVQNTLSFPLELVIYPSMYCDLSCGFCFLANREERSAKSAQEWGRFYMKRRKMES